MERCWPTGSHLTPGLLTTAPQPRRVICLSGRSELFCYPAAKRMCRNIKTLFNFDPPVTEDEVRAASLQFVRKLSGFTKPSRVNEAAFRAAVEEISGSALRLLYSLETVTPPRNRDEEAAKARARATLRFSK